MWRAFLVAGRLLTRLPWPDPGAVADADAGRAALFYPPVGLLIGVAVFAAASLLVEAPAGVAAALVLVLWVWLTGALHLDGLSDSADAWVGGLGSRERTLEIMRDPRAGAIGVVTVVLALLCKWTALTALIATGHQLSLVWVPMLARAQLLALLATTPYVRPQGMASATVRHLPRAAAWVVIGTAVFIGAVALGAAAALVVPVALGVLLIWRRVLLGRIGGFTGDTAGALIELTETASILTLALVLR